MAAMRRKAKRTYHHGSLRRALMEAAACGRPLVATDAPGVRSVIQTCEDAKKKNLSVVSGLCWRYHTPRRETMKRIMPADQAGWTVSSSANQPAAVSFRPATLRRTAT